MFALPVLALVVLTISLTSFSAQAGDDGCPQINGLFKTNGEDGVAEIRTTVKDGDTVYNLAGLEVIADGEERSNETINVTTFCATGALYVKTTMGARGSVVIYRRDGSGVLTSKRTVVNATNPAKPETTEEPVRAMVSIEEMAMIPKHVPKSCPVYKGAFQFLGGAAFGKTVTLKTTLNKTGAAYEFGGDIVADGQKRKLDDGKRTSVTVCNGGKMYSRIFSESGLLLQAFEFGAFSTSTKSFSMSEFKPMAIESSISYDVTKRD